PWPLMRLPVTVLHIRSTVAPGGKPAPLTSTGLPTVPEPWSRLRLGPSAVEETASARGRVIASGAGGITAGPSVTSNIAPRTVGTAGLKFGDCCWLRYGTGCVPEMAWIVCRPTSPVAGIVNTAVPWEVIAETQ